jgi:hypothetical protein
LAILRFLPSLNLEMKDLEDFDSNISIEVRPLHHRKDPRGLGSPDEFAIHPQEQWTSNCGDLEKQLASEELRSLWTHSTAKSDGEGRRPGEATEENVER